MTATYEGNRYLNKTGLEAYKMGMEAIREAAGNDVYILACGAPGIASFGYVDAWRQGADIAFQFPAAQRGPAWTDVVDQLRNLSGRWFLCDVVACDLDPWLLRKPHSESSAEAAAWVVALGGGGLYLSDDMRKLDERRLSWKLSKRLLKQSISAKAAYPTNIIPRNVPKVLNSPGIFSRLTNTNPIQAPEKWSLPDGSRVEFDLKARKMKSL